MKTLHKIIAILLALALILSSIAFIGAGIADAYQIPEKYTPINTPFAKTFGETGVTSGQKGNAETKGLEGAVNGAVVVLQILAGALLYFAAPLAILLLVFAGFDMVMKGADPEGIEAAKKHITWIIIGLLLIILSYSVVRAIIGLTIGAAELGAVEQSAPPAGPPASGGGAS